MSSFNDSQPSVSLQKPNSRPPNLPPTDEYGGLLPQLLAEPRMCQAGWGISWITKAFVIFKDQFLLWLAIGVAYLIIAIIGSSIPVINFIFPFLSFVFVGGIIKGCAVQVVGSELKFDHLFSAFYTHLKPLIILFILYLVAIIVVMIPMLIIFGGMALSLGQESSDVAIVGIVLGSLLLFILLFPVLMAIWFAPALIVLHNIEPVQAMKMSFKVCLKNILPFLVFWLIAPIIMILMVVFTLGLGLLALFPIGMITYYTSYRDVWTDQPLSGV
ncbi:BPSS1780 family membrane protein [Psychrobacter aquaticus]|uniref:Putative transmembrane protein n=1 Tax=Psychrobacter aquaticus CMS 56 TaxID=1354303 RepID=U4T2S9_9GAMM|nr:BPSS1780 family membrane protein [Psychrobacter aquaticus]ERL55362.1 putative transmembrane protein [Psychrobacter aquaticus CMS 56]